VRPDVSIDPDIVAFIEAQPRAAPYSVLAGLVREQFGQARAVDEATLREWWLAHHPAFARSRIGRDREVSAFILDLAGRVPGNEIAAALAGAFPQSRRPSRSALYRFLADLQQQRKA
jgi:hypothetical protein